jgi:copper(I)-binding protein
MDDEVDWMIWKNHPRAILIWLLLFTVCMPVKAQPSLNFEEAWIRAAPPGAMMMAAYGRFENRSDLPLVLTGFSSPAFMDVSLHRTLQVDGVSRMEAVPGLTIAAGGSVLLEPGGLHLMLHGPVSDALAGADLLIEITDSAGVVHSFELPVEKR